MAGLNAVKKAALQLLHFPAQWFETDFLDEQFLQEQLNAGMKAPIPSPNIIGTRPSAGY